MPLAVVVVVVVVVIAASMWCFVRTLLRFYCLLHSFLWMIFRRTPFVAWRHLARRRRRCRRLCHVLVVHSLYFGISLCLHRSSDPILNCSGGPVVVVVVVMCILSCDVSLFCQGRNRHPETILVFSVLLFSLFWCRCRCSSFIIAVLQIGVA